MGVHQVAWSWQPGQQDFKVCTPPCPSCLLRHSQESLSLYLSFQEVRSSSPLLPFPSPAPQEKCKHLSDSLGPDEHTMGERDRWTWLSLWLLFYSLCKQAPNPVPRLPLAGRGSPLSPEL